MNIVFEYIKYRLNAKYLHGIHSPFVYKFMEESTNIQIEKEHQHEIEKFISLTKTNPQEIQVKDYGAKSKKLKGKRTVSQIFKTSSSFGKNALLLYRLSNYFKPKLVLELGTSIGVGTLHLHLGHADSKIVSIELLFFCLSLVIFMCFICSYCVFPLVPGAFLMLSVVG